MAASASLHKVDSSPLFIQIVELHKKYREADKYFQETSEKTSIIAQQLKENQASLGSLREAISVAQQAQKECDELSSELGNKTFEYIQTGGKVQTLAEALYETPKEQTKYMVKIMESFQRGADRSKGGW